MPREQRPSAMLVHGRLFPLSKRRRSAELATTSGNEPPELAERVAALGAFYQAERQDATGLLVAALALVAGGLTYLGVASLVLNNVTVPGGHWTVAFLAFPLWVAASVFLLLAANAVVRQNSIEIIESALFELTGLDKSLRRKIGARAGQEAMDIHAQPYQSRFHTAMIYVGPLIVILAFSIYCLDVAAKARGWSSPPVIAGSVVYVILFCGIIFGGLGVMRQAGNPSKN